MINRQRGVFGALVLATVVLGGCAVYEPGPGYPYTYSGPAYFSAPVYSAPHYYGGSVGLSFGDGGHRGRGGHHHGWR